jgi:membrane associated rhomboid family serine protease
MRVAAVGHQCVDCVPRYPASSYSSSFAFGPGPMTSGVRILLIANVAMFVLQTASKDLERQLVLWTPAVAYGDLYRLLTSAFMHYGIAHLLFNMWALYVVGPQLESWLG